MRPLLSLLIVAMIACSLPACANRGRLKSPAQIEAAQAKQAKKDQKKKDEQEQDDDSSAPDGQNAAAPVADPAKKTDE
jgi:predicted small lipoprotein YifL